MADRCAGCMNKFKFREKPAACAKCGRNFCTLCIPKSKHKKSTPAVRETCIYCTRRVQEAMRQQEAGVMENFPDRFYHSPHVQAPVVTKLRLNEDKGGGSHSGPTLTEEDRKLEERLRKLKESHRQAKTGDSEAALHERLAKLRGEGESQVPPSSTSNQSNGQKTESEQADNLMDETSDRVRLERKNGSNSHPTEDSITTLLSGMDIQIQGDADPNKLFEEFRAFQSQQEHSAMVDATSKDVQDIVVKAKELQRQEQEEMGENPAASEGVITPYPQLPPEITVESHGNQREKEISESDISQVLAEAQREIEQEERKQRGIDQFVSAASKQLAELRGADSSGKTAGDSEVRSKLDPPRHRGDASHLDFSWSHFGGGGSAHLEGSAEGGVGGETAARQLGITLSSEVILDGTTGTDSGDEVSGLLKQTLAEAALDRRLGKKGLDHYLKPNSASGVESKSSKAGGAVAGGSSEGACAATKYPSGWEVDPDDLPWCCICNADAHIRCYDCDNDLYCTQCFSEGHEQFGLFDHKYTPFEPLTSRAV